MAERSRGYVRRLGPRKWYVRVYLGSVDGRKKYKGKTVHGSRADADRALATMLYRHDRNQTVVESNMPLQSWMEQWLETVGVRETTRDNYRAVVELYVTPHLGLKRLRTLTPMDVQMMVSRLGRKGLSVRTVRYAWTMVHAALEVAVKHRMIHVNPASYVDLPVDDRPKEDKSYTRDEARRILSAARSDRFYAWFAVALHCGLIPSEIYGLAWSDLDRRTGTLDIRRSLKWRRGGGWILSDVKRPARRRRLRINDECLQALHAHLTRQLEARIKHLGPYSDHGLIIAATNGEPVRHRNFVRRHYDPVIDRAEVSRRPPTACRHTCATLLYRDGEDPRVIAEVLGHSSVRTTLDTYVHVDERMVGRAMDRIGKILS